MSDYAQIPLNIFQGGADHLYALIEGIHAYDDKDHSMSQNWNWSLTADDAAADAAANIGLITITVDKML